MIDIYQVLDGAGFWDRGMGKLGDELTEISETYGTIYLVTDENDYLHIET